jgi:phage baseplate assembly protein W
MDMSKSVLGRDLKLVDDLLDAEFSSDLAVSSSGDLATVSEEFNLGQAIVNRIRTTQGELRDLGHALYGSRLYELVGEPNNDRTRELARLYTRESVARDPRVREIVSITVKVPTGDPHRLDIAVSVLPIGMATVLNIVFPFYLEVA